MKVVTLLLVIVFLSSCSADNQNSDGESQKALSLVKKVCDGDNKLSWKERAAFAAQANYLDKRWERLADAAYSRVAYDDILELDKNTNLLKNYPTSFVERSQESRFQYAKLVAECSILELLEKEEK